jgi:hypothetical protein
MLAPVPGLRVLIGGRDLGKARAIQQLTGAAGVLAVERTRVTAGELKDHGVWAVIDASGPFLLSGRDPYRVPKAALDAGAHYADLADGRDFVAGIGVLDAEARAAGLTALSGVSSTPALSSAVCDRLCAGLAQVDAIETGISPGNRAPRGLAVVRSILGYAGKPVRVWHGGRWTSAPGWGLTQRKAIDPAMGIRLFSVCDAPDLELFPGRYRVRDTVLFRGGLELGLLHRGLSAASQCVRLGLLPSLTPFAEMARDLAGILLPFGTDRGGMIVAVRGRAVDGAPVARRWVLVAEGGDGPNVPVLGTAALLRRLAAGEGPAPGARPCLGDVPLADFEAEFARFRIRTRTENVSDYGADAG